MKKHYVVLLSILISIVFIFCFDFYNKKCLTDKINPIIYWNSDLRNSCAYVMEKIITENSIVVLGSSELSSSDDVAYPRSLFKDGNSNYNMILIGRGYTQCLHHAINVGAYKDNLKNGKIVLILSPQWFTESHLTSDIYASRFQENNYVEVLKNRNINLETKLEVSERIHYLLTSDPNELDIIKKYEKIYLRESFNPMLHIEMFFYNLYKDVRTRFDLKKAVENYTVSYDDSPVKIENIDFENLLNQAELIGKNECTNNELGVYDEYFSTYIKSNYEASKNSNVNNKYTISKEYDDLRLFIKVCKQNQIEPLIISVPVNGRWYDYTGFPSSDRQLYYQNIRDICSEYKVSLADFSDKEYELYFLRDIMHMGWKGWVYLDEVVYEFFKK